MATLMIYVTSILVLVSPLFVTISGTSIIDNLSRNSRFASSTNTNNLHASRSIPGTSCDFEEPCEWTWDGKKSDTQLGFQLRSGQEVAETLAKSEYSGPLNDAQNNSHGQFLLLVFSKADVDQSTVYHLHSPRFNQSDGTCYLEAMLHMYNMKDGSFKMLMHTQNHTTWVPVSKLGNDKNMWERLKQNIGKTLEPFQVSLEFSPSSKVPAHIAIDNIRLVNCFPKPVKQSNVCSPHEFRCQNDVCIHRNKLCDSSKDCPRGEDENQECDRMPANTTCNFEKNWCGWTNVSETTIRWERTNKPSLSTITGPGKDHTLQDVHNQSGYFLYVDMNAKNSQMFDKTFLRSSIFAPPPAYHQNSSSPYYNSCQLRFFYHMFGPHVGSLHVEILELNPKFPKSTRIWTMSRSQGNAWHRESLVLPKISHMYYVQFVATRGARFAGDMALDDISLSRECVGLGVPAKELQGYSYEALMKKPRVDLRPGVITMNMQNISKYVFTSCGKFGRDGPTPEQCESSYKETLLNSSVKVLAEPGTKGFQTWTVPETKHYTLVAKGASGGRGAVINQMSSHGSIVKVTLFLRQGEQLYVLVGQEGASICEQNVTVLPDKIREICGRSSSPTAAVGRIVRGNKGRDAVSELQRMNNLMGGGGGGGGATFVFKLDASTSTYVPILVAAGGGGLGYNASPNILPYGRGLNVSLDARCGSSQPHGAGGGGGWKGPLMPTTVNADSFNEISRILGTSSQQQQMMERRKDNATMWISAGNSVLDGGGIGGLPCIDSVSWGTVGGYGGGGGGCTAGGAGGGYIGGNAHSGLSKNGEGGISFIIKGGMYPSVEPGGSDGPGSLVVIPSVKGCGCDYQCVLLDDFRFHSACVCQENWILSDDGFGCVDRDSGIPLPYLAFLVSFGLFMFGFVGLLCICLYNKYQRQKVALLHRKGVVGGPELQLSRLRAASGPGGVLTEYNPNYEFGGETYNLTDLKEIPRENLRLVKALGQGAFGEVYQGFYKHRAGDAVEMPVAVKTLPELSSNQAEMDFLMEALIMSKFNHPNIVHFIGVCFDKHPRFIILELLAGGDLKTFLRESRPKPERASPLTMKDLLLCAMDIAKGCKYLEENHFIHRDIAARNCLLTTKGPGRVVKIADFGMARDIYRADYYKKGGKAMLPVKWMPPEAFLDGIFTSKTDVWSYGVLLWEVLSLGYMPYPGRGNQDVMQLVTNGGRLEPPTNCPGPVYGIMTQCWHPTPEERPNFATLLERVGYCMQDPEVVNAALPVFQRPPSSERDATLMRPLNSDDQSCLRVVQGHRSSSITSASPNSSTADYLVPLTPLGLNSSSPSGQGRKPANSAPDRIHGRGDSVGDSPLGTPTTAIPESDSAQTLLEDEEEMIAQSRDMQKALNKTAPIYQMSNNHAGSHRKQNGIESGLTLNAAALDKSSRKPYPYVNVGVKGSSSSKQGKNKNEDEVRC